MPMNYLKIPDLLVKYHPYTAAYRAPKSELYRDFSPFTPRELGSYHCCASALEWAGERAALAASLKSYLDNLDAPQAAIANAARFAENRTVAIVAGHQPSLFGGPLFLALKLMGALKLCQQLNNREASLPETERFYYIPVYWNASEDHNRDEFCRATVFNQEHDLVHLALTGDTRPEPPRTAAETDSSEATELLGKLSGLLPETEFKDAVIQNLQRTLVGSLGEAMSRLVLSWFGEQGLVVVEPHLLRPFAQPVFAKALKDWREIHKLMEAGRQSMEERGYPPPLMLRDPATTLVYHLHENGGRYRLRADAEGYGYRTGKENVFFPAASIFRELKEHPERFSPAAALRPVMQASTLPVVAYIAGGGELAYHCQIRSLFPYFGVKTPMLLPRLAGTIIKKSLSKTMRRLGIPPEKLLSGRWEWDAVCKNAEEKNYRQDLVFGSFKESIDLAFNNLGEGLKNSGLHNLNELGRTRERCHENIRGLQRRLRQEDPVFGKDSRRRYFRLRKFALPGESYQDLSVWTVYFLSCFGVDLLHEMMAGIDPLSTAHHLFILE